jgi:hypothetical protein
VFSCGHFARCDAVVMSMQEYARLTRLNVAEFQRFCDTVGDAANQAGLTEEALDALHGVGILTPAQFVTP